MYDKKFENKLVFPIKIAFLFSMLKSSLRLFVRDCMILRLFYDIVFAHKSLTTITSLTMSSISNGIGSTYLFKSPYQRDVINKQISNTL